MPTPTSQSPCATACCDGPPPQPEAAPLSAPAGAALFRIATLDCASEESEIRRALEPVQGVQALGFQLGARTLAITASEAAMPHALDAIRRAGFDPQPLTAAQKHPSSISGSRFCERNR